MPEPENPQSRVTVADLDTEANWNAFELLTNSQDVAAVLTDLGVSEDYGALFVQVADGEYTEIWGCESDVPHLTQAVYRLYPLERE